MTSSRVMRALGRIMFGLVAVVWCAFILMLLVACTPKEPITEPGVYDVPAFQWRVVSKPELLKAYKSYGMPMDREDELLGFIGHTEDGLDVIYTTPVMRVDDAATTTLGHEVLHLVLGEYHD